MNLESMTIGTVAVHGAASPNIALTQVTGLGSPPPRRSTYSRARRHGAVDNTKFYDARVIGLAGEVWDTDAKTAGEAFDDLLAALALAEDDVTVTFRRLGRSFDEQVTARVAGEVEWTIGEEGFVIWGVSLVASDPLIYAVASSSGAYDPSTANSGKGLKFPLRFPIVFSGEATEHLTVTNGGTYPTPPTFTITGPVTNPAIDNDTTGESIYTDGLVLAAGEQAVIDVAKRELRTGLNAAYSDLILAEGPLAYWRFEEAATADGLADETGDHDATWADTGGITMGVAGPIKSEDELAASFSGSTGYATADDSFTFAGVLPFSVEAWVAPNTLSGTVQRIVSTESNPTGTAREGWYCAADQDGLHFNRFESGAVNATDYLVSLSADVWYHVVFVFDGETYFIYLNGSQVTNTTPAATRSIQDESTVLAIGARADTHVSEWDGEMDELAIYDFALTPQQVENHYTAALAVQSDGSPRADLIDPRQTTWFNLARGSNDLRLRGDDMVADETLLEVTFHDARI